MQRHDGLDYLMVFVEKEEYQMRRTGFQKKVVDGAARFLLCKDPRWTLGRRLETSFRCLRLSLSLSLQLPLSLSLSLPLSLSKTKSSRCSRQCQGGTDGRAEATAVEEDPLDSSRWLEWREVVAMAPGRNLEIPPSRSIPQFLRSTRLHLDNLAFRCLRRSLGKISKASSIKSF